MKTGTRFAYKSMKNYESSLEQKGLKEPWITRICFKMNRKSILVSVLLALQEVMGILCWLRFQRYRQIKLQVISSRHVEECRKVLTELGYSEKSILVCENVAQVKDAPEDSVLIVQDYRLVLESNITSSGGMYRKYGGKLRCCRKRPEKGN